MGLLRLLLFIFIAWLIWWLLKPLFGTGTKSVPRGKRPQVENMVRCAHCGLNLPVHEAIHEGDRYYCSEEHLRLDRNRPVDK